MASTARQPRRRMGRPAAIFKWTLKAGEHHTLIIPVNRHVHIVADDDAAGQVFYGNERDQAWRGPAVAPGEAHVIGGFANEVTVTVECTAGSINVEIER